MTKTINDKPIIFDANEVNAVLAGNKTQHRVPVDVDHSVVLTYHSLEAGGAVPERLDALPFDCPFGNVGDQLWVQEEHRPISWAFEDGEVTIEYRDGKSLHSHYLTEEELETNPNDDYPFAVVEELLARNVPILKDRYCFDFSNPDNLPHWRSADVMPKFASRLLLEVADIRIERVQDISENDAKAMGLKPDYCDHKYQTCEDIGCIGKWASALFLHLRHEKKLAVHYTDWVWVIEFKIVGD